MRLSGMKSVVFGIIIGVLTTVSITVVGISLATPRVEAWLQDDQVSIIVDGRTLDLPVGSHILNFNSRVHVPARFIAESLGATVHWDEVSQSVIIVSPDPEVIEREVQVPVEVQAPAQNAAPRYHYSPLPVRRVIQDVSLNITSMEFFLSQTEVIMDLEVRSQWPIMFLRDQTFLEFRGVRYAIEYDFDRIFVNSLPGNRYEREGLRMTFEPLDEDFIRSREDVDEIRLVIGVEIMERAFADEPFRRATFDFRIDASDEPFYDFRR